MAVRVHLALLLWCQGSAGMDLHASHCEGGSHGLCKSVVAESDDSALLHVATVRVHSFAEVVSCTEGQTVQCPGSTAQCAGSQCCPGGDTCPSASDTFNGCPMPKLQNCISGRPSPALCTEGQTVQCPGSTAQCAGNQCCPGGGTCPSASNTFSGCPLPKLQNCLGGEPSPAPAPGPAPAPIPAPSPAPAPSPQARQCVPAPSSPWVPSGHLGRGSGACTGQQLPNQVTPCQGGGVLLSGNPNRGCVWQTSPKPITLGPVVRIELDAKTGGTCQGTNWFAFWLDPVNYVLPSETSGEIDLIESYPGQGVATNFGGCGASWASNPKSPYCMQKVWSGVSPTAVSNHITMKYDPTSQKVTVYHCDFGVSTCGVNSNSPAFIDLSHFPPGNNPTYSMVVDIWNTDPSCDFTFYITGLALYDSAGARVPWH